MEGSNGEATAAEGGVVLGQGAIDAIEAALKNFGALCGECGRDCYVETPTDRANPPTHEFLLASMKIEDGKPVVVIKRGYACSRSDCDGIQKFREHPDVICERLLPSWKIIAKMPEPVAETAEETA